MCRLFVFVVCILLAYSIVEANRVKPVEKNERIAAKQHSGPAARNAKIDNPDMIKKRDAKVNDKKRTTRRHLEKTEKITPNDVQKERLFYKERQHKEKKNVKSVDPFAPVNKQAKRQMYNSTMGPIPTLEELMNTWSPQELAMVENLHNATGMEICVYHYAEFDVYGTGFVCEPGYCTSGDILCDNTADCTYFNDEGLVLCDIMQMMRDSYTPYTTSSYGDFYSDYKGNCSWSCITGYDPYTGEEMWGEISCDAECDGYMDCYNGDDEYCGGWYETYGCPIRVYDYWGEEYWMYTTIDGSSVCDGFEDCADGSDEEECYVDWYPDMSYDWYDLDSDWWYDSYPSVCAFDCASGNKTYDLAIDFDESIPCVWICDGVYDCNNNFDEIYCSSDSYMDSIYYKRAVDTKKSEEKKLAAILKDRQEPGSVKSNLNKMMSKKAKHEKQGKRHAPSVKKNTVHHK